MSLWDILKLNKKEDKEQDFSVSAVIIRADGTKQDLGVVGRGTVNFEAEGN
jgi:hypothetical protein